jgi:Carboxypeptidase regulatory-like domain/TonB dependent receptor-like, beta-barrel
MNAMTQNHKSRYSIVNNPRQQAARRTMVGILCFLLYGLLLASGTARAQVLTADVVGTVTDSAGAVLPNATVTVLNRGTNQMRVTKTSDTGDFTVTLLPVGNYSVTVESVGFKTFAVPMMSLSGGDRARVNAKLEVGQASETVQVTSTATALQTDTSTISQTVTQAAVQNLPLNGRNFISLAVLAPGATQGGPNAMSGGTRPDDRRQTSAISVNGQPETMNNYMIDGMDNNERYIGSIGVRPSVDALQEFSVKTNLYSAEVTKTVGGVINIITKSGSNDFHGTIFEFLRNDLFDANANYNFSGSSIPLRKGEYRQNQFGGSIGGPIRKDKTFFFGDYEGLRIIQGIAFTDRQVPTELQKTGDFSALLQNNTYIYDPALCPAGQTTADPNYNACHWATVYPGHPEMGPVISYNGQKNVIPPARIDQTIKNLGALFPKATSSNITGANYQNNVNRTQFQTTYDVRIDHHIGDKDMVFGRYSFNDVTTFTPNAFPAVNGILGGGCNCGTGNGQTYVPTGSYSGTAKQRAQNAQINYTHIFSPALVLQGRLGWVRTAMQSMSDNTLGAPNAATTMGIPGVNTGNVFGKGLPQITLYPYASLGDQLFIPELVYENTYQQNDDIHYTHGAHAIMAGFSIIRRYVYLNQSRQPRGWWAFNSTAPSGYTVGTNDTLAAFMLDMPQTFSRDVQVVDFGSYANEWGAYFQDDWRVTQALTLNLGLRWDLFGPFTARHNYMANWSPKLNQLIIPGRTPGVSKTANVKNDYKDFAPRIGFAATLRPGLVLRGGYGISYYEGLVSTFPYMEGVPFTFSTTANCGVGQSVPCPTLLQGTPVPPSTVDYSLAENAKITGNINGIPENLKAAYIEQWSLNVEKDFRGNVIGVGYVGNGGHRQLVNINQNLGTAPSFNSSVTVARPLTAAGVFYNPATGKNNSPNINLQKNVAYSNYNALQVTLDRRMQRGLTVNAQYTFAKGMGNAGSTQSIAGNGGMQWISNFSRFDYGRTGLDVRHHFAALITYALPWGNNLSGPLAYAAKGWQVNTVYQYSSGLPLTILNPSNRLNIVGGGADRPNRIASVKSPHTLKQWFDASAFQLNTPGFPGSEQVYSVNGTPFRSWDLSVSKNFALTERYNLQFRAEGFNVLNMTNFLNPNGTLTSNFDPTDSTHKTWGSVGQISGLAGPPRQFQFAAKIIF